MWKKIVGLVCAFSLVAGVFASATPAATPYKAANHELTKYWSAWLKHPNTYLPLVAALALYRWPTERSSKLAHKLAYELQAYENGDNRSGDWRVTYLLLRSALGEVNPFT